MKKLKSKKQINRIKVIRRCRFQINKINRNFLDSLDMKDHKNLRTKGSLFPNKETLKLKSKVQYIKNRAATYSRNSFFKSMDIKSKKLLRKERKCTILIKNSPSSMEMLISEEEIRKSGILKDVDRYTSEA